MLDLSIFSAQVDHGLALMVEQLVMVFLVRGLNMNVQGVPEKSVF